MQLTNQSTMSRHFAALTVSLALIAAPASAQTCPFDDGNSSLEVEGLILTRYALGVTGAPLVASTGINAVEAPSVAATINCPSCGLNITGNPTMTVADATIISRKLAGFTGTALTDGLALGSGTRNTAAAVQSFLLAGCGASGGTVTSITAGPGLTGGTITTAGTINLTSTQLLPTTACSIDQIAKWNGSAWVCAASVLSLPSGCVEGQVLRLGSGGSIQCKNLPPTYNTIDSAPVTGEFVAMTSSATAFPIMTYYDRTNGVLKVVKCSDLGCSGAVAPVTIDSTADVGQHTAIALTSAGKPVISYYDVTNSSLKVATCSTDTCLGATVTRSTLDSVGDVGQFTSIAMPADGLPVISYYDATNTSLKIAKCSDSLCTAVPTITTVDILGDVGRYSSIAVPADGLPVVTYLDNTSTATIIKLIKCGTPSCSSGNTIVSFSGGDTFQKKAPIALGANGFPVTLSLGASSGSLRILFCGNATCTTFSAGATVFNGNLQDSYINSLVIPADGLPVIALGMAASNERKLRVIKCLDPLCSNTTVSGALAGQATAGRHHALTVPADGLPVVSYFAGPQFVAYGTLGVVKCSNAACLLP
jgi:hypothetical protein